MYGFHRKDGENLWKTSEMEKDTIISHGAGHFIMEKFRDDSDGFDIYVCRTCGNFAIVNEEENIAICNTCQSSKMDADIVKVRSTWASKLWIQELMSCNVGVKMNIAPFVYETNA